jgi:flagellar basal-body rod protein FlgG
MANVMDVAAIAMGMEMRRVETIAHNIANATTPGFKRQLDGALAATAAASSTVVAPDGGEEEVGLAARPVSDFADGKLSRTDSPLHLALSGPGFFVVRTGSGLAYTRGGVFTRDAEGRLVTPQGGVLQADGGDLALRSDTFTVTVDGTVIEEQRPVARLMVADFRDRTQLSRGPGGVFLAPEEGQLRIDAPVVRQGFLEMGNVDLGHEMVRMMEAFRRFEMNQRLVQGHDDMIGGAVRRLGDLQS